MAKIGVVTFHRASNYGAVLQAYALQEMLKKLGHDSEVIDYRCEVIEARYRMSVWRTLLSPRRIAVALLKNGFKRDRREIFDDFRSVELPQSEMVTSVDLPSFSRRYDMVLTGSDQVWNHESAGFDTNYFLAFVPAGVRKGAFSASIGRATLPPDLVPDYKALLEDFYLITVREKTGARALAPVLGYEPKSVVDPTLLLNRDDWVSRFGQRESSEPYILLYLLSETRQMLNYARRLSKSTGMEVRYVTHRLFRPRGVSILDSAGPSAFVREMLGCSALVTNSFHGMAFAVNFGLDLHYDLLPSSSPVNSRITDIAAHFGLEDRRVGDTPLPPRSTDSVARTAEILCSERANAAALLSDMTDGL